METKQILLLLVAIGTIVYLLTSAYKKSLELRNEDLKKSIKREQERREKLEEQLKTVLNDYASANVDDHKPIDILFDLKEVESNLYYELDKIEFQVNNKPRYKVGGKITDGKSKVQNLVITKVEIVEKSCSFLGDLCLLNPLVSLNKLKDTEEEKLKRKKTQFCYNYEAVNIKTGEKKIW